MNTFLSVIRYRAKQTKLSFLQINATIVRTNWPQDLFVLGGTRSLRQWMTFPRGGVPANPNIDEITRPYYKSIKSLHLLLTLWQHRR